MINYKLDESGNPVPEPNSLDWAMWFENADRKVARDTIGESTISTVFLGLDHNFSESGPPVLWETMVFGGPLDQHQCRCSGSREQAEAMHAKVVSEVEKGTKPCP